MYNPGSNFYVPFTTSNASGISTNTDSLPTSVINHNGLDDFSVRVFVTNIDVGRYINSGTIPSTYAYGDTISLASSGYVNGLLQKGVSFLGALANANIVLNVNSYVTGIAPGVTISVTGNVPTVGQVLTPVSATGITATANITGVVQAQVVGVNPGLTISVTGNIPTVGSIINPNLAVTGVAPANFLGIGSISPGVTISVTGTVQSNIISMIPGLSVSVTGSAPLNFLLPGTTVSVTGVPQVNVISVNPGVAVSVTGNIISVSNIINPVGVTGTVQANVISSLPGVTFSVTGTPQVNVIGINPGLTISVTGIVQNVNTVNTLTNPASITGTNVWNASDLLQLRYKIGIDGNNQSPTSPFNGKLELSLSGVHNIMIENNINMNQWMSVMGAALAGSSIVNGNNVTYYAINNNGTQRLSSTAISGSRNVVVLFLP